MELSSLFSNPVKKDELLLVIFINLTAIKLQSFLLLISSTGVEVKQKSKIVEYEGVDNCVVRTDESLQQLGDEAVNVDSVIFSLDHSWIKQGVVVDDKKPLLQKLSNDLFLKPIGFISTLEAVVQQQIVQNSMFSGVVTAISEKKLITALVYQGKLEKIEGIGRSADIKGDFLEGLARFSEYAQKKGFYLPTKIFLFSSVLTEEELKKQQQAIYSLDWQVQKQFLQPPTVVILLQQELESALTQESGRAIALQRGIKMEKDKDVAMLDSKEMGFSEVDKNVVATSFGVPISSDKFDSELVVNNDDEVTGVVNKDEVKPLLEEKTKPIKQQKIEKEYKNYKLYSLVGFILGIVGLVVVSFFTLSSLARAKVTVTLETKPIFKEVEISLDTSLTETDVENLILAANTITKTKQSTSTMQTTGIKVVGEKAKGKVTLYNRTDAEKTFEKGTLLKSGELEFSLDDEVSVPPANSSNPGVTQHGKVDASVTAVQIGADSNLAKDVELEVIPFDTSSYYAYSIDDGFAGGSSREVKVVAPEDRVELLADLKKELIEDINIEFAQEQKDGVYILPSNKIVNKKINFNSEVGDEADELTLTLELTVEAMTYTTQDLKPLASKILSSELDDNYQLFSGDPKIMSKPTKSNVDEMTEGTKLTLTANISSFAVPKLSADDLKTKVLGKNIDDVKRFLLDMPEIKEVKIDVLPSIASSFIKKMPSKLEKIELEVR